MDSVGKEMTKEEKEKLLNEKIEAMRKRNEEIKKRHEEIENDKKLADKHSASAQINDVKPYVMKPPRPRPEKIVNASSADSSSEGDVSFSPNTNQEYLLSRQRLSQSDGPPPDPSYRFLADPDRDSSIEGIQKEQPNEIETINKKENSGRGRGRGRGRIDDSQQYPNVYAHDHKQNRGRGRGRGGGYPENFRGRGRGWEGKNNSEGRRDEASAELEDESKNCGRGTFEHWHDRGRGRGGFEDRGRGRGRGRGGYEGRGRGRGGFEDRSRGRGRGRGRGRHLIEDGDEINNGPTQKEHYKDSEGSIGRGKNMRRGSRGRGQQRAYQQWKAERDAIDEARITRARSGDGEWRREWDMQKIDQESTENDFPIEPNYPRSKGEGFTLADMVSGTELMKLEDIQVPIEKSTDKKTDKGNVKDRLHFPDRNQDNWREIDKTEKKLSNQQQPNPQPNPQPRNPPIDPNYFEHRQEKYKQSKLEGVGDGVGDGVCEDEEKFQNFDIINTILLLQKRNSVPR